MKKIKPIVVGAALAISLFSLSSGAANASTKINFKDIKGHWAESDVKQATEKGYLKGYEDQTFRPKAQVTRAEFAAMLSRAIPKDVTGVKEDFTDVSDSFWGKSAIEKGIALGFISPSDYTYNKFQPNKAMTRAEISKWMANGLNAMNPKYGEVIQTLAKSQHTLIPIPEFYKGGVNQKDLPYIGLVMGTGLLNGYEDYTFRPNSTTTRAEVAAILLRLVKTMEKEPASFRGINELVEVAKTGTNVISHTKYEYRKKKDLSHVLDKPITFRNNVGVGKLHRLIFIDSTPKGDSIYHHMFADKRANFGDKVYNAYSEVSFTARKDTNIIGLNQNIPTNFAVGEHIYGLVPHIKFGINTINPSKSEFKIGQTKRFWTFSSIPKTLPNGSSFLWHIVRTDDGSTSGFVLGN